MKKQVLFSLLFLFAFTLQSFSQKSVRPSDKIITKEHKASGFTNLKVANDFKAYVTFTSGSEGVKIEANENLHELIVVQQNGNTLEVRFANSFNIRGKETLHAYISVQSLESISGRGDAEVYLENTLKANSLNVSLRGDSILEGELEVGDMTADLRGDSVMKIKGEAKNVRVNARGDSVVKSYDFETANADIDLTGDSVAHLTVTNELRADISGDSSMRYKGNANVVKQRVVGDSELVKQ